MVLALTTGRGDGFIILKSSVLRPISKVFVDSTAKLVARASSSHE
jgi:hypothetical protein